MTSSPGSFATAKESPTLSQSLLLPQETPIEPKSEDSLPSTKRAKLPAPVHFYRPAKELPYELHNHAYVYFSEESYSEAITLLTKLLEAGYGITGPEQPSPTFVPSPQQLALLATLTIHPKYSSHAKSQDARRVSQEALRYLRTLNKIVGPVNAALPANWKFGENAVVRRGARHESADDSDSGGEDTRLTAKIANNGSLWRQTTSFWNVVGWALNCSIKYPLRWPHWRRFLDLMISILEDDWRIRVESVEELKLMDQERLDALEDAMQHSLIWSYMINENPGSSTGRRKILRAIFADASKESLRAFPEIFLGESKELEAQGEGAKRQLTKIDIEANDFGDYDSDDSESNSRLDDALARRSSRQKRKAKSSLPGEDEEEDDTFKLKGVEVRGGMQSLGLRQRLLNLLSEISLSIPRLFTEQTDLFDNFTEYYNSQPASLFMHLLSSSKLSDESQNHLNSLLIFDVVARERPPRSINPCAPSLSHLKKSYFPLASKKHSTSEHAKISMLLESFLGNLIREMRTDGNLRQEVQEATLNESLRNAVLSGIEERQKKAIGDSRKKAKGMEGEEETARAILENSSTRLKMHLYMLENSKCFGRRVETTPNTPTRLRYVLVETPTPQKKRFKLSPSNIPTATAKLNLSLSQPSSSPLSSVDGALTRSFSSQMDNEDER